METPVISVIIPIYNTEEYLEECLDTVFGQTFTNFELICVDDGSTDRSREILDAYAENDDRIKIICQQNRFAGTARNNGLKTASGEYVLFLDSDDFFETDMFERLYDKAKAYEADICICNARNYFEATGRFGKPQQFLDSSKIPSREPFSYRTDPDYIFNFTTPAPWNMLYKRSFLLENGLQFQEIKRANDLRFFGMAIVKARSIVTVKKRLVNYRVRATGNLQSQNDETPLGFYSALLQVRDEVIKMGILNEVRKSLMNHALSVYTYNMDTLRDPENFRLLYHKFFDEVLEAFYINKYKEEDIYSIAAREKYSKYKDTDIDCLIEEIYGSEEKEVSENSCMITDSGKSVDVSVIIPVYNTCEYLEKCITSVIEQTLTNIEIICINDGSTDDSLDILKKFAAVDERIVLVDKKNEGVSKTRNTGMNMARGKYIAFMDSDDYFEKDALEILYNKAVSEDLEIVFYNTHVRFLDKGMEKEKEKFARYYKRVRDYQGKMTGIDLYVKMHRVKEYKVSVCMQFYKKTFVEDNSLRFFEGILHEDNLFTFRAILYAHSAGYVKNQLYNRTVRNNSIMTSDETAANFIGYFTCYSEMLRFANIFESKANVSEEAKSFIGSSIHSVYNSAVRIYRDLPEEDISDIIFDNNSIAERLYWCFKRSEVEIRRIKKSNTFKTGKIVMALPIKMKENMRKIRKTKR